MASALIFVKLVTTLQVEHSGRRYRMDAMIEEIAKSRSLIGAFDVLKPFGVDPVDHWTQGEYHHDVVVRVRTAPAGLPGNVVIISTNCNGGVKEVLCFDEVPDRLGLWHHRCPDNPEFAGDIPLILGSFSTIHWKDPCGLLGEDAYNEYKADYRRRQRGGGWVPLESDEE